MGPPGEQRYTQFRAPGALGAPRGSTMKPLSAVRGALGIETGWGDANKWGRVGAAPIRPETVSPRSVSPRNRFAPTPFRPETVSPRHRFAPKPFRPDRFAPTVSPRTVSPRPFRPDRFAPNRFAPTVSPRTVSPRNGFAPTRFRPESVSPRHGLAQKMWHPVVLMGPSHAPGEPLCPPGDRLHRSSSMGVGPRLRDLTLNHLARWSTRPLRAWG
jgi:hypothetical protein